MLRQLLQELILATRGRGFTEFTGTIAEWITKSGIQTGLVTLHLQHTSASLLIQENADPDVRHDFERYFPDRFNDEIDAVCGESSQRKKRELKSALLIRVVAWIAENPDTAKTEFSKSAKEVVDYLHDIACSVT